MIIIYYDGAVQTAFEELVKFVSGSRTAMRKGKMAATMAEMRRAAELEVDADDDDDDNDDGGLDAMLKNSRSLLAAQKHVPVNRDRQSTTPGNLVATDSDGGDDLALPKLNFASTRQMGPMRDSPRVGLSGGALSVGLLKGYRRAGMDTVPDIFDELDKGLEWCQGQCEHAAHQFLREGDCSTEIANIKGKLEEVRIAAEKESDRLNKAEAANPTLKLSAELEAEGRGRVLKAPLMRKEVSMGPMKDLEVDDNMEVDDAEDELELPPKLIFKRSRDVGL